MVATDAEVDLEEVERWSHHEGMAEEFERIKELLKREPRTHATTERKKAFDLSHFDLKIMSPKYRCQGVARMNSTARCPELRSRFLFSLCNKLLNPTMGI